jgi:hypothetical protein
MREKEKTLIAFSQIGDMEGLESQLKLMENIALKCIESNDLTELMSEISRVSAISAGIGLHFKVEFPLTNAI